MGDKMKQNNYNYNDSIAICETALDMLPICDYLEIGASINEIMDNIEADIEARAAEPQMMNLYLYMLDYPEIFYDDPPELFNYMTESEFLMYCQKRFPQIKWGHEIIENYWVKANQWN